MDEIEQAKNDQGRSWYAGWLEMFERLTRSRKYQPVDTLVRESGRFSHIHSSSYFSPINWPGNGIEHGEEIGEIMNKNMRVSPWGININLADSFVIFQRSSSKMAQSHC